MPRALPAYRIQKNVSLSNSSAYKNQLHSGPKCNTKAILHLEKEYSTRIMNQEIRHEFLKSYANGK